MVGFVMLHREFLNWEWYQSSNVSRLYIHLILKVNFIEKKWQGIIIERGQLVTSINSLSEELKLSEQQVRTAILKLEEGNYIIKKATNNYTLITLVNYDKYQSSGPNSNKRKNIPKTNEQQTENNQSTTTKKSNNSKNINNETIEVRREIFKNHVFEHSSYSNKILNDFFNYWTELNSEMDKMRFETQGYFEIDKRLKKWATNEWKTTNKNNQHNTVSNR